MANEDQLKILQQGVFVWNKWRTDNPDEDIDLSGTNLKGANLSMANLSEANLFEANLIDADLTDADLSESELSLTHFCKARIIRGNLIGADLVGADLSGANLSEANLSETDLSSADLNGSILIKAYLKRAYLVGANLMGANLSEADIAETDLSKAILNNANLRNANLIRAILVETALVGTILTGCKIYGISAWGLKLGDQTEQKDLIITPESQPTVTVDNIEEAQFIYLLLHNEKIRDAIDTIARKAVLILGRFTPPERKSVLDALRKELRKRGYLPIVFEFEKPTERDFTETIKILAGISLFAIADISNPKSSPLELQAIVPDYMIPFVPIIQDGEEPFAMFRDLQIKHHWVLQTLKYKSIESLIRSLDRAIIKPALQKHKKLSEEKAKKQAGIDVDDFEDIADDIADGIEIARNP